VTSQFGFVSRNVAINIGGQLLPLTVALASYPLTFQGLGPTSFGVFVIVSTLITYLRSFEASITRGTTKYAAGLQEPALTEERGRLLGTSIALHAAIGLGLAATLVAVAPIIVGTLVRPPQHLVGEAILAIRIAGLLAPLILVMGSYRAFLEARQRFDRVNMISVVVTSLSYALPAVAALNGATVAELVMLLIPVYLGGTLATKWLVGRTYPVFKLGRPRSDAFRRLAFFAGWLGVSGALIPILVYADRFILASAQGVAAVGYYSVPFDLANRLLILPAALTVSLFPGFAATSLSGAHAMGGRALKYLLLSIAPLVSIVILLAPSLLSAWIGPAFAEQSATALRILAIGLLLNSLAFVPYSVLQAVGRPDIPAKLQLAEAIPSVVLAAVFIVWWGVNGAAVAWTIRAAADAVLLFASLSRVPGVSRAGVSESGLRAALLASGVVTTAIVSSVTNPLGLPAGLIAFVTAAAYCVVGAFWVLTSADREAIRSLTLRSTSGHRRG
jgi:O-antigen/teichoic acid export membrane protein